MTRKSFWNITYEAPERGKPGTLHVGFGGCLTLLLALVVAPLILWAIGWAWGVLL